jgi:CubicO group peptidase (beta-lactamase class C family)
LLSFFLKKSTEKINPTLSFMKYLVSLTIVFIFLTFPIFGQIHENESIDSIFVEWNKPNSPGCSLGVIKDGKLVYARGYGMANLEYSIPNSPVSVFRIGSTSKQFTAACIVLLAEQGKLKFDDKLSKFFPEFPEYADEITIAQLLNHSSGIRDYLTISYLSGLGDDDFYTDKDIMQWLINQKENNFKPNEEFLYSNSGYWLLGQIVQEVTGQNMAHFAEKNLFLPLGMNNTHFHNDHTHIVSNRASGYVPVNDGYKISMTTLDMIGDGGIFTTINDLKLWDDNYYESKVLSDEFWDTMIIPLVLNNGDTLSYAKGIGNGKYKGLKTLSHGGAFVGFRADMIRFPDQKTSIIVLANRGDANPTAKAYRVADIILKDDFIITEESKSKSMNNEEKVIKLSIKELEKHSATYWNSKSNYSRKIYLKNDTLRYFRNKNSENKLLPIGKNEFKMLDVAADLRVKFNTNEDDKKIMIVTIDNGEPIKSLAYEPVSYKTTELKAFTGSYYSSELGVKYDLRMKNDSLMLYIKGKEISMLSPLKTNLFSNENYGIFKFIDNPNGTLNEFKLMAGRVKNLKFIKE